MRPSSQTLSRLLVSFFMVGLLAGVSVAETTRALVLSRKGKVEIEGSDKSALTIGNSLTQGLKLKLAKGSTLVLLDLYQGKRLSVTGPGKLVLGKTIQVVGCRLQELKAPRTVLKVDGENLRKLGGAVARNAKLDPTGLDLSRRFEFFDISNNADGSTDVFIALKADKGPSPQEFELQAFDYEIKIGLDEGDGKVYTSTMGSSVPPAPLFTELKFAELEDFNQRGLWVYKGQLPPSPVTIKSYAVKLPGPNTVFFAVNSKTITAEDKEKFEQDDLSYLDFASEDSTDLSRQVMRIAFNEDQGRYEEALILVNEAIRAAAQPIDLFELKLRLLLKTGRFAEAQNFWKSTER